MPFSSLFLPDDPDRAMTWLNDGWVMAYAKGLRSPAHLDVIWTLIEDAVEVVDRLPDQDRRFLSAATKSAGFDSSGLSRSELLALEQLRYLCAMMPHDDEVGRTIDRDQAVRALDVMTWFRWVGVYVQAKDPRRLTKAAVALARGGDSEIFHRILRPGMKPHRQAVKNFRIQFCGHILTGLRKDLHIVRATDGRFIRVRDLPPIVGSEAAVAV